MQRTLGSLNDTRSVQAYASALQAVAKGKRVLDMSGAPGAGLLAMVAAQGGAQKATIALGNTVGDGVARQILGDVLDCNREKEGLSRVEVRTMELLFITM